MPLLEAASVITAADNYTNIDRPYIYFSVKSTGTIQVQYSCLRGLGDQSGIWISATRTMIINIVTGKIYFTRHPVLI